MYLQSLCKHVIIYKSGTYPGICVLPFKMLVTTRYTYKIGEVNFMAKNNANGEMNNVVGKCMVRNVHITVGIPASQRYIISKTAEESIDDMFLRLKEESKSDAAKKECETCRTIIRWAEECDGEVCNVISTYDRANHVFIIDICIDFREHTDSEKFCNGVHLKLQEM